MISSGRRSSEYWLESVRQGWQIPPACKIQGDKGGRALLIPGPGPAFSSFIHVRALAPGPPSVSRSKSPVTLLLVHEHEEDDEYWSLFGWCPLANGQCPMGVNW